MIVDPHPHPGAAGIASRLVLCALLAGAVGVGGCGSGSRSSRAPGGASSGRAGVLPLPRPTFVPPGARRCPYRIADALGAVAQRIYGESATGPNARQAAARVEHAPGLARAVAAGDRATVRSIAARLMARRTGGRIARLIVLRGPAVLADTGGPIGLAPATAVIRNASGSPVGSAALSVQSASTYAGVTAAVTGARVQIAAGARVVAGSPRPAPRRVPERGPVRVRGRSDQAFTFPARALPAAPLRISLLIPPADLGPCPTGAAATAAAPTPAAETEAAALAAVGRRIYQGELQGPAVTRGLRSVSASIPLRRAIDRRSPAAARSALAALLVNHMHIVRLRLTWPGRRPIDLGGPAVLAPVTATLPAGPGRAPARIELSIQDDHGYVLLAHRFTGAEVLLRQGARQIEGTLNPGLAPVPDRGPITYQGARYLAYSFSARSFPSGVLRISLLYRLS